MLITDEQSAQVAQAHAEGKLDAFHFHIDIGKILQDAGGSTNLNDFIQKEIANGILNILSHLK